MVKKANQSSPAYRTWLENLQPGQGVVIAIDDYRAIHTISASTDPLRWEIVDGLVAYKATGDVFLADVGAIVGQIEPVTPHLALLSMVKAIERELMQFEGTDEEFLELQNKVRKVLS